MRRPRALHRVYSVELGEDTNTRMLPDALVGVLTLDEYQHVLEKALQEHERARVKGTRLLKFATHFPCVVLCLMPLVVRYLARMERRMLARQQAHCASATAEQGGRVEFSVRQVGGVGDALRSRHKRQQLWLDMRFADPAPGHVRDNLYELQAPAQLGELPPPRPHTPPDLGSDTSDSSADSRMLLA